VAMRRSALLIVCAFALQSDPALSFACVPRAALRHPGATRCPAGGIALRPRQALGQPPVMLATTDLIAVAPAMLALDMVGVVLKLAWRLAAMALVFVALRPTVVPILEARSPELLAKVRQRVDYEKKVLTKIFRPKLHAAREADAKAKAADAAARAQAEEEAKAKLAAEAAEAEAAAAKAADEAARKQLEEQQAKAKAAAEKMALEREAAERERAEKVAEEQRRYREQLEREKAAKEKAADEKRAKEREIAEKKAAAKAAAEKAAAEAKAKLTAVVAACGEAEARVRSLLDEIAGTVEEDRIVTMADAGEERAAALQAGLEELETGSESLPVEVVREGLLGFWSVRLTTAEPIANDGRTGYGKPEYATVLAHFQCFSKREDGSLLPTAQTVEVIGDASTDAVGTATLKGDFELAADGASGAKMGVLEDYNTLEFGGMKQFDAQPPKLRWTCIYLSPTLRVNRMEDDSIWVYEKVDAEAVTGEIFRLMSLTQEEEEEEDWSEAGYDS